MPDPQPGTGADWPAQATDLIVRVVGQVRDKTTGPALTLARGLVYGSLATLLGTTIAVLLAIAAVRGLDEAIEGIVDSRETWAAHAIVGLVFTLAGLLLWSKRRAPDRG
jgi:ABC-type nickel/cobalt efflux system permease component RcnA